MANPLREIKKKTEAEIAGRHPHIDGKGRIVIHMLVKDDDNFLSSYSATDTPMISSEVAEFIEMRTRAIPPKEPLLLRIQSNCIDQKEQEQYRAAIHEYYVERYMANRQELRRNHIISAVLLLFGTLVLAYAIFGGWNEVGAEILDIVAWVLIWEAADISFFSNRSLRWKEKHYLSYLSMEVEYIDDEKT